ncbi:fimbrial protein [Escherichia coli]|uniref:F4 family fimbrial subunit n=1 Tax=Escherichia coli TaxID=562 RepID=UPI00169B6C1B|nr:fimbrial protein [Escherichia coli]EFJ8421404.1 fimbrial protein [Escherichia coli]EHC5052745.1 fimbrial protein [Escherichia coli]EJV7182251.1 fimbrial protein [Escherichia coli]
MNNSVLLFLMVCFFPFSVFAWNTPGQDFSGELKLGGAVTSTRNPWVWIVGEGKSMDVKQALVTRSGYQVVSVPLPAMKIVLGKTVLTTPAGREGLAPRIIFGKDVEGFSLVWTEPGIADVTLPVKGEDSRRVGSFTFRMQVAGLMRYVRNGQVTYTSIYDDVGINGLPDKPHIMNAGQIPGLFQSMFSSEGPKWLSAMAVSSDSGVSHFNDTSLRLIEGVYGARIVADSGELHLKEGKTDRWNVSLPVSIEYQ